MARGRNASLFVGRYRLWNVDMNATTEDDKRPQAQQLNANVEQLQAIDGKLLNLLLTRAEVATEVAKQRKALGLEGYDPELEEQSLALIEQQLAEQGGRLTRASIRTIFREILSACAVLETPLTVGYLGPPGTFSHIAARSAFGLGANYVDFPSIGGIFTAVDRQRVDYGVVPIENSTEGGVTFTLDSFLTSDAKICGEFLLDVTMCLIGKTSELGKLERIYSHPQPLGQCRAWLAQHTPQAQLISMPSTTAAAREAANDERSAAVGSHLAAELLGLEIIAESIQDMTVNVTRFVLLSNKEAEPTGRDRTSLVFSTPDEKGALLNALTIFSNAGLNLSRIESRPGREKLWEYVFFTDIEGHQQQPQVAAAIDELRKVSRMVRVLGSYPQARRSASGAEPPK
jgi:chorismate mutase/prephenate dehydratase